MGFIRRSRRLLVSGHNGQPAQPSARQAHAVPLDGLEEAGDHLGFLHLQESVWATEKGHGTHHQRLCTNCAAA